MRLDKYLKVSRIIKRRTTSKEVSDASRVKVNQKIAKPSQQLKINDIIEIEFGNKFVEFKVLNFANQASKETAQAMYEIVGERQKENNDEKKTTQEL